MDDGLLASWLSCLDEIISNWLKRKPELYLWWPNVNHDPV